MIIEFITSIVIFFILWCIAQIIHEYSHYFTAKVQGLKPTIEIWNWKGIPSLRCIPNGSPNKWFYLNGGLGTSFIYCLLSLPAYYIYPLLTVILVTISGAQFIYSYFELLFHNKPLDWYMKYHYVAYLIGGILFFLPVMPMYITYLGIII